MKTKPSRYKLYCLGLLTAGHFFSDFYGTFLPALLPFILSNLHLSLTAGGMLVMFHSAASNILQPFCGYYVDKSGYTWIILASILLSALFICMAGIVTNYSLLVLCLIVSGIGVAVFHPIGSSLVNNIATEQKRSLWMSIFIGGGNFGFAIAPAIVTFMLVHYSTVSLFWLVIPAIIVTVLLYFSRLYKINVIPKRSQTTSTQWYKSLTLLKLNFVMAMRSWTQVALTTFLPIMLSAQGHATLIAGNMLTAFLFGGALGGLLGGYIGDKIGPKTCIWGALVLSLPTAYCFIITTQITIWTWISLLLAGAFLQGTMPSSIVWAQEVIPENKALASGMMLGLSCGIGGIGTAITGAIGDIYGIHYALLLALIPLVLAIPVTLSIPSTPSIQNNKTETF